MKRLLILLLVLMAFPVYGQVVNDTVLVYKVTASFKPWIDYNVDSNDTNEIRRDITNWVGTTPLTAYLVVEVNDANKMVLDDNDALILVPYGRNGKYLFDDPCGPDKWYLTSFYGAIDSNHLAINMFRIESDGNGVFGTGDLDIDGLSMSVYGKTTKNVAIGATAKVATAKTLKGNIVCHDVWLIGGSGYNDAVGSITLTLDSTYTKYANNEDPLDRVSGVLDKITGDLGTKSYKEIP